MLAHNNLFVVNWYKDMKWIQGLLFIALKCYNDFVKIVINFRDIM